MSALFLYFLVLTIDPIAMGVYALVAYFCRSYWTAALAGFAAGITFLGLTISIRATPMLLMLAVVMVLHAVVMTVALHGLFQQYRRSRRSDDAPRA